VIFWGPVAFWWCWRSHLDETRLVHVEAESHFLMLVVLTHLLRDLVGTHFEDEPQMCWLYLHRCGPNRLRSFWWASRFLSVKKGWGELSIVSVFYKMLIISLYNSVEHMLLPALRLWWVYVWRLLDFAARKAICKIAIPDVSVAFRGQAVRFVDLSSFGCVVLV